MEAIILPLFISSCYGTFFELIGWQRSFGVKGKLTYNGIPAAGVVVRLYEMKGSTGVWDRC
ncbi:hypothetical protein Y032_0799g2409, partial [Ancylostoma ceylanicum]